MALPLERLQDAFGAALRDAAEAPSLVPELAGHGGRALERLALYRGNVDAAHESALANAYPVVRALVGDEYFTGMAHEYRLACPAVSGDLNRFGAELPDFVRVQKTAPMLPYLGDVAALEWLVHRSHYAADAEALPRERIVELPARDLLGAHVDLHPACAWMESSFAVASIWQAHQHAPAQGLPETVNHPEHALIVRRYWWVEVLTSSAGETTALARLRAGSDVECAIGAALAAEPGFNFARALVRWLDHSIVVALRAAPVGATCGGG